jgi:diacylglycerol kinase
MLKKHFTGYQYAFRGIWLAFRYENNMVFHLAAAGAVLLINYFLHVSQTEWLITLILIGLAWTAEIFNTAIERLADHVSPGHNPLIGQVKDLAAGAVLVICSIAAICGTIIYFPYVWALFCHS